MMSLHVSGIDGVIAALEKMAVESVAANLRIVQRGQAVLEAEAKKSFTGAHAKGAPTTSRPGSPPDVVSGTLRRSIKSSTAAPDGAYGAKGSVYPTAVYARIMELGGRTGRGGRTTLPARPFLQPAYVKALPRLREIAVEEWRKL